MNSIASKRNNRHAEPGRYIPGRKVSEMKIDSADLIRKLPAMIQGRRIFAKMADGGNFHVGEPDNWCLTFKDVVTAIEDYCEYKLSGRFSLSAPVDGNWDVMNAYPYKDPFEQIGKGEAE